MIQYIGYFGSILLAFCGLPEAVKSIQTKSSSLTWTFLLMWLIGEIAILIYVIFPHTDLKPLYFNYISNILFISIIIYYKRRAK